MWQQDPGADEQASFSRGSGPLGPASFLSLPPCCLSWKPLARVQMLLIICVNPVSPWPERRQDGKARPRALWAGLYSPSSLAKNVSGNTGGAQRMFAVWSLECYGRSQWSRRTA